MTLPFSFKIVSPTLKPAAAAGPCGTSEVIIAPPAFALFVETPIQPLPVRGEKLAAGARGSGRVGTPEAEAGIFDPTVSFALRFTAPPETVISRSQS